jgi:dTMP kinase
MVRPEDTLFIVVEGIDGCGKDTQILFLSQYLRERGRDPLIMTDPGSTPVGEGIRKLVLDGSLEMNEVTQALLYTAARASLVRKIGDARREGHDVICGRWVMSTVVYQGMAQHLSRFRIEALHKEWVRLDPDIYIVIDIPADEGLRRRKAAVCQCCQPRPAANPNECKIRSREGSF